MAPRAKAKQVATEAQQIELMKRDFVAFLFVLWRALNLPKPTRMQIDMARTLATGEHKRFILQAFRGIGKSFITCAFVVWKLWNNPQLRIEIVSAAKDRADANAVFIKRIIQLLPFLHHLKAEPGQRDSVMVFDVGPAQPDHSPSVKSVGITGQLTGSRADILIADDVEVPGNSSTQSARDVLSELVKEFDAILKPEPHCQIIYLGTPQTEMTLYRELENRGYVTIIWPARYPRDEADRLSYGHRLAPILANDLDTGSAAYGDPTDPVRFNETELRERELSYGKAGFALQFMLNPALTDAEKYPLKLRDLIVAKIGLDKAPLTLQWLPNAQNEAKELPNVGLKGDRYHRYQTASDNWADYQGKVLAIDPSGRGKDETGYAVVYMLNGFLYVMEVGGFRGGYDDHTLEKLAQVAKRFKVNDVVIESNFGDGMFTKIFTPVLSRVYKGAGVEEIRSTGQKEVRIADTLEPLMGSHRLVVSEDAIVADYRTAQDADGTHAPGYSCFYQMTRLTRDRGALKHDDRLDALEIAVRFFVEDMSRDADEGEKAMIEDYLEEQMADLRRGFNDTLTLVSAGVTITINEDDGFGDGFYGNMIGR